MEWWWRLLLYQWIMFGALICLQCSTLTFFPTCPPGKCSKVWLARNNFDLPENLSLFIANSQIAWAYKSQYYSKSVSNIRLVWCLSVLWYSWKLSWPINYKRNRKFQSINFNLPAGHLPNIFTLPVKLLLSPGKRAVFNVEPCCFFVIDLWLIYNNLYRTFEICKTEIHQISLYVNTDLRQTYFHIKK